MNMLIALIICFLPVILLAIGFPITSLIAGSIIALTFYTGYRSKKESKAPPKKKSNFNPVVWMYQTLSPYMVQRADIWDILFENLRTITNYLLVVFTVFAVTLAAINNFGPDGSFFSDKVIDSQFELFCFALLMLVPVLVYLSAYTYHYKVETSVFPELACGFGIATFLAFLYYANDLNPTGPLSFREMLLLTALFGIPATLLFTSLTNFFAKDKESLANTEVNIQGLALTLPMVAFVVSSHMGMWYHLLYTFTVNTKPMEHQGIIWSDASNYCPYEYRFFELDMRHDCWMREYLVDREFTKQYHSVYILPFYHSTFSKLDLAYIMAKRFNYDGLAGLMMNSKNIAEHQLEEYFTTLYDLHTELDKHYRPTEGAYIANHRTRDEELRILQNVATGNYKSFWVEYLMLMDEIHQDEKEKEANQDEGSWMLLNTIAKALVVNNHGPDFDFPGKADIKRGDNHKAIQDSFDKIQALKKRIKDKPLPPPTMTPINIH